MKRCKACGNQYRGNGTVALVKQGRKLVGGIVCPTCSAKAIQLVLGEAMARCKCGEPATKCHACATGAERRDKAQDVGGAVKKLEGMVRAIETSTETAVMPDPFLDGKREGLEIAIELLKSGRY